MDFLRSLDSDSLDAAQQAAESMSQWDSQTDSQSDLSSIDSLLCQTLAHIVRCRLSSAQHPTTAEEAVDSPGSPARYKPPRRAGRHAKRRGKMALTQTDTAPIAEPAAQGLAESEGALKALRAEEKRLHAAVALFGSEGLKAAVPMIADLCVLHEYEHALQLSSAPPGYSAPTSSLIHSMTAPDAGIQTTGNSLGTLLVGCRGSWQSRRDSPGNTGTRIADVRPSLRLERLYKLVSPSEMFSAYQPVLLAAADTAMCSGNFQLAEKLLGRAAQLSPSSQPEADINLRQASLQVQLDTLIGQSDRGSSASQLYDRLQAGGNTIATCLLCDADASIELCRK